MYMCVFVCITNVASQRKRKLSIIRAGLRHYRPSHLSLVDQVTSDARINPQDIPYRRYAYCAKFIHRGKFCSPINWLKKYRGGGRRGGEKTGTGKFQRTGRNYSAALCEGINKFAARISVGNVIDVIGDKSR